MSSTVRTGVVAQLVKMTISEASHIAADNQLSFADGDMDGSATADVMNQITTTLTTEVTDDEFDAALESIALVTMGKPLTDAITEAIDLIGPTV